MNSRIFKSIFFVILTGFALTSCTNGDHYNSPEEGIVTYALTANKTVLEVKNTPTGLVIPYSADDIIEAYVTSSDETGNFYNSISFQTIPTDGSNPIGFSIPVELKSFKEGFTPGRKVYIKLKGLYTAIVDGSLKIGSLYDGEVGRIAAYEWKNHLFPSATVVSEDSFIRTLTLTQAANNDNLNTLIDIDNVQFADGSLARTLYDIDSGGGATNHNIVDVTGGTTRYLRVSKYALFAVKNVSAGRGKIRGVMTKYGSDYQFIVRYQDDIKLNNPRTYTFNTTLNEGFESFTANQKTFQNYLNFYTVGSKDWIVKSGNYIEMSSFGGNVENNKSYFVVPVNMTAANTISFQVGTRFYKGSALKVYRTTNYVPGMKIQDATLYDISTNFTLPTDDTSSTSTHVFVNSGTYAIPPNITGNGYFVFEYAGTNIPTSPALTTTVAIDNIVIN